MFIRHLQWEWMPHRLQQAGRLFNSEGHGRDARATKGRFRRSSERAKWAWTRGSASLPRGSREAKGGLYMFLRNEPTDFAMGNMG